MSATATEVNAPRQDTRVRRERKPKKAPVTQGPEDIVEEVPFDIGSAGALIGKGGSNIEKITTECGVKSVRLDRLKGVVALMGPKDAVEKAKSHVSSLLASVQDATPLPFSTTFTFNRRLGRNLVGKEGANIKSMEEQSKAKITIDRSSSTVIIRGADQAAVDAGKKAVEAALEAQAAVIGSSVEEITNKLKETKIAERTSEPLPFNTTVAVSEDKYGAVIGRRGTTIRYIQRTFKVKVAADKTKATAEISGRTQEDVDKAKTFVESIISGETTRPPRAPRTEQRRRAPVAEGDAKGTARPAKKAGERRTPKAPATAEGAPKEGAVAAPKRERRVAEPLNFTASTTFNFDVAFIPAIVGRSGMRIRLLQRRTQSKVTINREEAKITIDGVDQNSVDEAKKFIDGILAGESPSRKIPGVGAETPREPRQPRAPRQPRQPRTAPAAAEGTAKAPAEPRAPRQPREPVEAKFSEVFDFPAEYRSSIIGQRGSVIRRTQRQTNTNVIIEKEATSARIEGATQEAVAAGKRAIEEIMARRDARVASARALPADLPIACTFQFDARFMPIILGRGGSTVRKLQQDSKTRIEVNKESSLVTIRGSTQNDVDEAKKLVEDLLANNIHKVAGTTTA